MNWNREYHYYLIFGDTTTDHIPWETDVWKSKIYPVLDKILSQSTCYKQTGVNSLQYVPKPGTTYYKQLKIGRLSWNINSQEKWTLNASEKERQFHHLDVWTPSRAVCGKNNTSPDIFFNLFNERDIHMLESPQFDTFAVLAVARELNYNPLPEILQLSASLNAKKTVYRIRGWQQKSEDENWNLVNSIQDTTSTGLYKGPIVNLQKIAFEKIVFMPFWEIVYER